MCRSKAVLAFVLFFGLSTPAFAQWQQISTIPEPVSVIKFFSASFGLLGTGSSPGGPVPAGADIYRTTDGGFTWTICPIPLGYGREVTDFWMTDSLHGWASVVGGFYGLGVWVTSDGGVSWQLGSIRGGGGSSVAMTSHALVVTDLFANTLTSTDLGNTWTGLRDSYKNDVAFFDDDHGITTSYRGANWSATTDGGQTWNNISQSIEDWSVYPVRNSSEAFAAPEGNSAAPSGNTPTMVSTDYGINWKVTSTLPFRTTGHIAGLSDTALFVQWCSNSNTSLNNQPWLKHGIYRSKDKAKTWSYIGGPEALNDTRFCTITGCGQGYLYTFEEHYPFEGATKIWRYQFPAAIDEAGKPVLSDRTLTTTSSICSSARTKVLFFSPLCEKFTLESIRFSDSSLVTTRALQFTHLPALPHSYENGHSDSVIYLWSPKVLTDTQATFFDTIVFHCRDPFTGMEYDTTILLTLSATPDTIQPTVSPNPLAYPLTSTCSFADSVLYITNPGCEQMMIDSVRIGHAEFSILRYDTTIASGDRGAIYIRYEPSAQQVVNDDIFLFVSEEGVHTIVKIPITGNGVQGLGVLAMKQTSLDAGSFSFCVGDTEVSTSISNVGCDTLIISNIALKSDGMFSLTTEPSDSLLAPNGNALFSFHFAPRLKGVHQAQLSFHSRNLHGGDPGHDTTITISGFGLDGTKLLAEAPDAEDLGSMYSCQSRDTVITLYNTGCDTVTITDGSFSNPSFSSATSYPFVLPPGDSLKVLVHADTSNSNGALSIAGSYSALSKDAQNSLVPVPIHVSIIPPVHLLLQIVSPDSGSAGATVVYAIRIIGPHPQSLFSAFHFNLIHNDDLLSYIGLTGTGLSVISDSNHAGQMLQHFTLSPIPLGDTVGWLTFKAYLSKDSTTSLDIAKFASVNVFDEQEDCIASIADSGTTFRYIPRCGDEFMRLVLEGEPFVFDGIHPNPANDQLSVTLHKSEDTPVLFELIDALGHTIVANNDVTTMTIATGQIPSGVYYARLSQDRFVQTRRVIIQH